MSRRKNQSRARQGPKRIGEVVGELLLQKGFGRFRGAEAVERAWREAVDEPLAGYTRPGRIRRGVLEVVVANSTVVQELVFQKGELLLTLKRLLPDTPIKDLRFQVGSVSDK